MEYGEFPQRIKSIKNFVNKMKILELKNIIESKNSKNRFNAILDTEKG